MFFVFLFQIISCKEYIKNQKDPVAVIPFSHKNFHLNTDGNAFLITPNMKANTNTAIKIIKKEKKKHLIEFVYNNSLLCFSKKKMLIKCEKENAKGSFWNIKKKKNSNGWIIQSDKESGFSFWSKKWCLSVDKDKQVQIAVCDKNDEDQKFYIVPFKDAINEDFDPNKLDQTDKNSGIDDNKYDESGELALENKNIENPNQQDKTELQLELEKIDDKTLDKMTGEELKTITNNFDRNPCLNFENRNDFNRNNIKEKNDDDFIDVQKTKDLLNDLRKNSSGELNDKYEKDRNKEEKEKSDFIAGSFGIESHHNDSKEQPSIKPDKGIENLFGVSEDPRKSSFNPVKAAALKLYSGIDKYIGKKLGNNVKIDCKEELENERIKNLINVRR